MLPINQNWQAISLSLVRKDLERNVRYNSPLRPTNHQCYLLFCCFMLSSFADQTKLVRFVHTPPHHIIPKYRPNSPGKYTVFILQSVLQARPCFAYKVNTKSRFYIIHIISFLCSFSLCKTLSLVYTAVVDIHMKMSNARTRTSQTSASNRHICTTASLSLSLSSHLFLPSALKLDNEVVQLFFLSHSENFVWKQNEITEK